MIKLILDRTMMEKKITRYELAKQTGIQYQIIDKYYKNKIVRYDSFVLDRICTALSCKIEDVIQFEKE